ncbi:MAG: DUF1036 domain-containing protein [Nitrospira sp.]|nr:DUF1036 domain-containing protein [Nitrospira sp.]
MNIKVVVVAMVLSFTSQVFAADVYTVQPGDVYYLWRLDGPNTRVQIREVDRRGGRVKVAYPDGEVRWVAASDLKTKDEAQNTDIGLGLAAVGTVLLVCALSDLCKDSPTQSTPPPNRLDAASGGFRVTNSCRHPVRVAIHYRNLMGDWTSMGWWTVNANQSTYLADSSNKRLATTAETWFYYAESTDQDHLVWKGDRTIRYGNLDLPMVQLKDKDGDSEWSLTCNGM